MSRIFLSYSRLDGREARALKQWLADQDPTLQSDIYLDVDPVTGNALGAPWKDQVRAALQRCETVVCLVSANWDQSTECRVEFRTAENLGKPIICARLDEESGGFTGAWHYTDLFVDGLPADGVTAVTVATAEPVSFATRGLLQVRDAIWGRGISASSYVWPPPGDPDRIPFRGWEPFEETDAGIFFGRDAEIVTTMDELQMMRSSSSQTLLALLGPSGSGKSSFLRAGLVPRLLRDESHYVVLGTLRPGRYPLTGETGLARSIYEGRRRVGLSTIPVGDIKAACQRSDTDALVELLVECVRAAERRRADADADLPPPTLVLPLDQMEELFGTNADDEAKAFLKFVDDMRGRTECKLIVVATIRSDRYPALQAEALLEAVEVRPIDLRPMRAAHFGRVITGPAERATQAGHRLTVEAPLHDQLLSDAHNASEGGDALPLLSVTLSRLYKDYGSEHVLTRDQYLAMGGLGSVVQTEIDQVLAGDTTTRNEQLELLKSAFIPWLATINPDTDLPLRRLARWSEIPDTSHELVEAFVEKRLLVKHGRDGDVQVEVALESLLRQWKQLDTWLDEHRDEMIAAAAVTRSAAEWEAKNRDKAYLLEGSRLLDAENLAKHALFGQRVSPASDFISASRAKARTSRRIRWGALAAIILIPVLIVSISLQSQASKEQAAANAAQAVAMRLNSEAESMLAGQNSGGDARAFLEILAAKALTHGSDAELLHATAIRSNTIKVNDTGKVQTVIAYRPGGRMFVTGGEHTLQLWNADTGQAVGPDFGVGDDWVSQVAFSPDGSRLAAVSSSQWVRVWDTDSGRRTMDLATNGTVDSVAFSPDGHVMAVGGADQQIRLWDVDTGQSIGEPLTGHTGIVNCLAFSPDGRRLLSGGGDGTLRLWDRAGKSLRVVDSGQGAVYEVAYSPDGKLIATGGSDGTIRLWNPETTAYDGQWLRGHTGSVLALGFSADGHRLASGGFDNSVRIWNIEPRAEVGLVMEGHTNHVGGVAFDPNGHRLASASDDGSIRLWDVDQPIVSHENSVEQVSFSPDGARLASASSDGTVRIWDPHTGLPMGAPLVHPKGVYALAFSPDGTRLATGGGDGKVRMWDPLSGRDVGPLIDGDPGGVFAVAFSHDGRLLASAGYGGDVWLSDAHTGRPFGAPLKGHTASVTALAFSPTSDLLASASNDNSVRLWHPTAENPAGQALWGHGNWVLGIAFSPDGRQLASAGADNTVQFWDTSTGEKVGRPLTGHFGAVRSVAYSPNGKLIATSSDDGSVRLWDAVTGVQIAPPFTGHTKTVSSVAFRPDGNQLASGSNDFTVRLWPTSASAGNLCDKLLENMSGDEWRQWVDPNIPYATLCPSLPAPP